MRDKQGKKKKKELKDVQKNPIVVRAVFFNLFVVPVMPSEKLF